MFGYRRAGNGFGALVWGSWAAVFALFSLASLLLGLWWFGLALIPLVAHAGARTIGRYREGHLF